MPIPGGPVRSQAWVSEDKSSLGDLPRSLKSFSEGGGAVPATLRTILEGRTHLRVPAASLTSRAPKTYPVFFNPAARLNRDISVALAAVTRPKSYLDALAGTGARGVRVANEAGSHVEVTILDFNERSLSVAKKNVEMNHLSRRCFLVHSETNRYLYSRFERGEKFDAIDVDPFGTPAPYIQAALVASADGAIVSFTATDAAVLCGVYPSVALRRYGSMAPRSEFVHETAVRILAAFAARMGGINDIGVSPIAAHSTLHYLRVYTKVKRGASAADQSLSNVGYVTQCNVCFARFSGSEAPPRCPACGAKVRSAGPLWTGGLCDETIASQVAGFCASEGWSDSAATIASIIGVNAFPPFGYSLERCASRIGSSSVPMEDVAARLRSSGFRCMIQPFEDLSVKTDAGIKDFTAAMMEASRSLV